MIKFLHPKAAAGRWYEFSAPEQMGNIGSEVHRSIVAHEMGDTKRFEGAFERALELFDLMISDPRWRGSRLKEICRAREVFCSLFYDAHPYDTPENLDKYFLEFGLLARKGR